MTKTYSVIIPNEIYPLPTTRELSAARIVADFLRCDVVCVARNDRKTPDFLIGKDYWELKTPTGAGKYNIQHLLHTAIQQSNHIIVDARFSKMHITRVKSELIRHSKITTKNIKRLLLIDKYGKVIEIL